MLSLCCSLSLCLSVVLSLSLSVHLWRNLLASCNKPLHMRRLAGYTHTHIETWLGTCNRRRQRPVTVSGSMRLPHKNLWFLFCVFDKQNHQSNNNNNKRNQFCLLCRQIKVPPGGRHDPRPGLGLTH